MNKITVEQFRKLQKDLVDHSKIIYAPRYKSVDDYLNYRKKSDTRNFINPLLVALVISSILTCALMYDKNLNIDFGTVLTFLTGAVFLTPVSAIIIWMSSAAMQSIDSHNRSTEEINAYEKGVEDLATKINLIDKS